MAVYMLVVICESRRAGVQYYNEHVYFEAPSDDAAKAYFNSEEVNAKYAEHKGFFVRLVKVQLASVDESGTHLSGHREETLGRRWHPEPRTE